MTIRHLAAMFTPSSIALITAGTRSGSIGGVVARNLLGAGFEGEIFLVDSMGGAEGGGPQGIGIHLEIRDLPRAPDLGVILQPPETVPRILRDLGEIGTKAAVVLATGYPESKPWRWRKLLQEMREAAKPYTLRIIGPDSLGILAPTAFLNASCAHVPALSGWLAFVGQSDLMISSVLDWATHHRIGFSHFVSLGEMTDVDFGDMLDYLANDSHTRAILLYIETIPQVRKFMSAARAASRLKPVIVFKAGRHDERRRRILRSGAMSGLESDLIYDAAFRRAGMLRVSSIQGLFDAAATLAALPSMAGDRLGILTNSPGAGRIAADSLIDGTGRLAELSDAGVTRLRERLPEIRSIGNPLEIGEEAGPEQYRAALDILMDDPGADAILVLNCPHAMVSSADTARAVIDVHRAMHLPYTEPRPLLTSWIGQGTSAGHKRLFLHHSIPSYETPDDAIRAFLRMVRYRRNQEMLMETPPNIPDVFTPSDHAVRKIIARVLTQGREELTTREAMAVLRAYRIPTAKTGGAKGEGPPWVPLPHTHELLLGMAEDPWFGPVIRFGHGGKAAEVIADQAFALPPLNMHLAREVMTRTRIFRLLEGYGKTAPVNLDALALTLVKVSQLICDTAEIRELVINPLLADPSGVTVINAVIRVLPSTGSPAMRLAIRPYPKALEDVVTGKKGERFLIRPIRPEDEPAFCDLFASMSREEVRLRFFRYMKAISHALAARLTQLDYDRQMAFVLTDPPPSIAPLRIYGAVHVNMDPDNETAEFAIMVRSDMTGKGLGSLLMRRIIEYCRRKGVGEIFGDVLMDNKPMLALSRSLGFRVESRLDDPGSVVVRLRLRDG